MIKIIQVVFTRRFKVAHVNMEIFIVITVVFLFISTEMIDIMSIIVVILPVLRLMASFSLLVKAHIILNVMLEVSLPVLVMVISSWDEGLIFMIVSFKVFIIESIMWIHNSICMLTR